jgi:2-C-methyl-D-erythritol 4-phosphate cytidylyltransferase
MKDVAVVIPAAGQGLRFGGNVPKQFVPVMGKPLLCWTIFAVLDAMPLSPCVVVLPRDDFQYYKESLVAELGRHIGLSLRESSRIKIEGNGEVYLLGAGVYITIVPGGSERQESVWEGLKVIPSDIEWVAIHDGARPLVSKELFISVVEKARLVGAAIAAVPARDTVKQAKNHSSGSIIEQTLDRSTLWLAQTPQVFRRDIIIRAYEDAFSENFIGTDDASLVERLNHPVALVEGDPLNIKITSKEDMEWLVWHLQRRNVK